MHTLEVIHVFDNLHCSLKPSLGFESNCRRVSDIGNAESAAGQLVLRLQKSQARHAEQSASHQQLLKLHSEVAFQSATHYLACPLCRKCFSILTRYSHFEACRIALIKLTFIKTSPGSRIDIRSKSVLL